MGGEAVVLSGNIGRDTYGYGEEGKTSVYSAPGYPDSVALHISVRVFENRSLWYGATAQGGDVVGESSRTVSRVRGRAWAANSISIIDFFQEYGEEDREFDDKYKYDGYYNGRRNWVREPGPHRCVEDGRLCRVQVRVNRFEDAGKSDTIGWSDWTTVWSVGKGWDNAPAEFVSERP